MERTAKLLGKINELDARMREAEEGVLKARAAAVKVYAGSAGSEKRAKAREELLDAELALEALRERRSDCVAELAKAVERDLADAELAAQEAFREAGEAAKALEEEIARAAGRLAGLWTRRHGPAFVPGMDPPMPSVPSIVVEGRTVEQTSVFREGYTEAGGPELYREVLNEVPRAETEGRRLKAAQDDAQAVSVLRGVSPEVVAAHVLETGSLNVKRLARRFKFGGAAT